MGFILYKGPINVNKYFFSLVFVFYFHVQFGMHWLKKWVWPCKKFVFFNMNFLHRKGGKYEFFVGRRMVQTPKLLTHQKWRWQIFFLFNSAFCVGGSVNLKNKIGLSQKCSIDADSDHFTYCIFINSPSIFYFSHFIDAEWASKLGLPSFHLLWRVVELSEYKETAHDPSFLVRPGIRSQTRIIPN